MWEKCHPVNSTAGSYAQQLTNTLLRFFFPRGESHYGKRVLWFQKGFTEVTVIIQKAVIPKALQVGFPPMDLQGSAWRLCQLYSHCVYNAVYQTQHEGGECFESICKLCPRYGNLNRTREIHRVRVHNGQHEK